MSPRPEIQTLATFRAESADWIWSVPDRGPRSPLQQMLRREFMLVDSWSDRCRILASQARSAGEHELADAYSAEKTRFESLADDHEPLVPRVHSEFRTSAANIVAVVADALESGDPSFVLLMGRYLRKRFRRLWLARCVGILRRVMSVRERGSQADYESELYEMSEVCGHLLAVFDRRAYDLSPEHAEAALDDYFRSQGKSDAKGKSLAMPAEGFAARIAVACGAFDYGPNDYVKAKKAFTNLKDDNDVTG